MTRLFMSGWETGDVRQIGTPMSNSGVTLPSVVTIDPTPRSGAYCMKASTFASTTAGFYSAVNMGHAPVTEMYYAFGLYFFAGDIPSALRTLFFWTIEPSSSFISTAFSCENTGIIRAYYANAGGALPVTSQFTLIGSTATPIPLNTWVNIEIRLVAATFSTGVCQMKINGVTALDVTNTRTCQIVAQYNGFQIGQYRANTTGSTTYHAFDDLRVNTTAGSPNNSWPGDTSIRGLVPDSVGTTIGGTPLTGAGVVLRSQGKTATAIDTAAGFPPFNITDGDDFTYWRSTTSLTAATGPWFQIDFGAPQQLDAFFLYQSTAIAGQRSQWFRIDSSDDQTTWFMRYISPTGLTASIAERAITRLINPGSHRYWRFTSIQGSGNAAWVVYGAGLYEADPAKPNWQNVVPPTAADYNYGSTLGTGETYGLSALGPAGPITAVNVVTLAYNTDGAGGAMGITVKTPAGTSEGPPVFLGPTPALFNRIMETDPSDASAWTAAKINALEAGITVR